MNNDNNIDIIVRKAVQIYSEDTLVKKLKSGKEKPDPKLRRAFHNLKSSFKQSVSLPQYWKTASDKMTERRL